MWNSIDLYSLVEQTRSLIKQSKNTLCKGCILLFASGAITAASVARAQETESIKQPTPEQLSHVCLDQVSQSDFQAAVLSCQAAVALSEATGNPRLAGYASGNLGTAYLHLQQYSLAVEQYQQALAIATEIADPDLSISASTALGSAYLQMEQPQQAIEFHQQALQLAQQNNRFNSAAIAAYNLGLTYETLNQPQQAIDFYRQSSQLAQAVSDPLLEAYAQSKLSLYQAQADQSQLQLERDLF